MSEKKKYTHEGIYLGVKQSVWRKVRRLQQWGTSWCNAKFSSWPQKCAAGLSGAQRDPRVCRAHRPKQHRLRAGHCCSLWDITSEKQTSKGPPGDLRPTNPFPQTSRRSAGLWGLTRLQGRRWQQHGRDEAKRCVSPSPPERAVPERSFGLRMKPLSLCVCF